jgi:lipoyl(octanoyl) transferase
MSIEIKVSKRRISYKKAMNILDKRVQEIKENKNRELLWILEHPVSYTAGVRYSNSDILDKKIKIIKTNRGGKITLHAPGQKIVYFVLNLNKRKKDIKNLIKQIEISIIDFLKLYKIKSYSDKKKNWNLG